MGQIAQIAEQHHRKWLPKAYAAVAPARRAAHFQEIEDEALRQIEELTEQLAGPATPGEPFADRAGLLRMARHNATEQVMRELVLVEPEPEMAPASMEEDAELTAALRDFADARDELARLEQAQRPKATAQSA